MSAELSLPELLKLHLDKFSTNTETNTNYELETRFGTKGQKITRIQFEKVIQVLKSKGFSIIDGENGMNILKIQNEFIDPTLVGSQRVSRIRSEIEGITSIQDYCKTDSITKVMDGNDFSVEFVNKTFIKDANENMVFPINVEQYNLRISYQKEISLFKNAGIIKSLIAEWGETKKIFRYMNRTTFTHPLLPFKIDMSIVKSSTADRRNKPIPVYNIEESGLFKNPETFEIEIELNNELIKQYCLETPLTSDPNVEKLKTGLMTLIKHILSGLQDTPYPISYPEITDLKSKYLEMLYGSPQKRWLRSSDFCGPSSYTLQMVNIQPLDQDTAAPNIRRMYSVTDKADGERKLLFINEKGLVYLINTNMDFQFTGTKTTNAAIKNTLLDGEHITHNKNGKFINLFAAFDIYFINNESVRNKGFIPTKPKDVANNFRLPLLQNVVKKQFVSAQNSGQSPPLTITSKRFKSGIEENDIFKGCQELLNDMEHGMYEYETDGLIFTPLEYGVGCTKPGEASKNKKITWELSFKWKPPEFNTIDFLVTTKKNANGGDITNTLFKEGTGLAGDTDLNQYKIIQLRCGFDESKHGYINPCNDVYLDNIPSLRSDVDNEDKYKPAPFYPTNPSDSDTHICYIPLKKDSLGEYQMMTEDGEVFYDETIVEFKFVKTNEDHYKWVPIRIRYDKTAKLKKGEKEYGNAYHVANSNWYSIHNPISKDMLKGEEAVPQLESDDDVYYNRFSSLSYTESLRNFHNLYVKHSLIKGVSKPGDTLIDFAVGMGGDFSKWIKAKLSFVFGVDVSKDNIENRTRGACARYLNLRKDNPRMPYALFLQGNSSVNIRDGSAYYNEKDIVISKSIFGDIPKDTSLGEGVVRQYGKGNNGFSVSSCQFALHYFFENKTTLYNFVKNVSECTKIGGHFIGTCYDGKRIFDALKKKKTLTIMKNGQKIWEISKGYSNESFNDDESSLGYSINVYQETINKVIREYLVNFEYFKRVMENNGFRPITDEEAAEFKLPSGIGGFKELHNKMYQDIKLPKYRPYVGSALNMTSEEKQISFFNNYFVFVKITDPEPVMDLGTSDEKTKDDADGLPEGDVEAEVGDIGNIDDDANTFIGERKIDNRPAWMKQKDLSEQGQDDGKEEKEKKTKKVSKKPKKIRLVKKKKDGE